ncbi:hypothetical protein DBR11_18515 [Pedobacter sp. HMWF019]|uniref:MbnP family protein n=1 Tax=Pedobacter sp. HMWF019 TaxID=2056856 RepID=UPI000D34D829|nr:MbnP family protein [Pedobacter sp. HMWF019]PTS96769.1 hypothetical protein DBR11_18515 [Pedobacter sp. HMWF019]
MKKILSIIGLSALLFTSCSKDKDAIILQGEGKVTLTMDAVFGNQDFALKKDFTTSGITYNFTKFRYWLSNVVLVSTTGQEIKVSGSYYLMEETGEIKLTGVNNDLPTTVYPATKRESVVLKEVPAGDYKSIKFSIGVDQKYNDNMSLQSGELSQLNGMTNISWMWLTSYIFTSAGGKVSDGKTTKTMLIETGLNANYKTIVLDLPKNLSITSSTSTSIVVNADLSKVTDGIDVMTNPVVGASKATVMAPVANNYANKVFTIKSVN